MPFNGPVIPFGATVEYHPISAKDQSGLHQFGARVFGTPRQKAQCKGSVNVDEKVTTFLPSRRGNSQNLGGDRRLKPSTLIRDRPDRGEEQEIF